MYRREFFRWVGGTTVSMATIASAQDQLPGPEPAHADVPYGDHPRQMLDVWKADAKGPTPFVFFIHGGGWVNGDKSAARRTLRIPDFLARSISVVSINYRYVTQAQEAGVEPPVSWPLADATRALQFVRSRAQEWNLDRVRAGACGSSAGACSSLWLAFHNEMAQPSSTDPVARESTRLHCAAVLGAQTSLDPKQMREWMPNITYGGHAFGFRQVGQSRQAEFQRFHDNREKVLPWIREYSPYEHAGAGDPPVFLEYPAQDKPARAGETQTDPTHSAVFGLMLQERLRQSGCEAHLAYPGHPDPEYPNYRDFLMRQLAGK